MLPAKTNYFAKFKLLIIIWVTQVRTGATMKAFEFLHSASLECKLNKDWQTIRTKLKDFDNDFKTMDITGLRSAADEIVFIMYTDDKHNFKQYNSLELIQAYKNIVDDLEVIEQMHLFYDEFKTNMKEQNIQDKNVRFLDPTLTFVKLGRNVKNYLTVNIAEKVETK